MRIVGSNKNHGTKKEIMTSQQIIHCYFLHLNVVLKHHTVTLTAQTNTFTRYLFCFFNRVKSTKRDAFESSHLETKCCLMQRAEQKIKEREKKME